MEYDTVLGGKAFYAYLAIDIEPIPAERNIEIDVRLPEDFDLQRPSSLGTEIINALSDQINARIENTNDGGAVFTIHFQDL